LFGVSGVLCAQTDWGARVNGRVVEIESRRWRVTIEDGLITELVNKLTGEVHARGGVRADATPSGLGVQAGALDAARSLHAALSNYNTPIGAEPFPSQHRPFAKSNFTTVVADAHTIVLKYKGLAAGAKVYPEETLELRASLAGNTGDLLLTASGASPLGGVYGVTVGVVNITKDSIAQLAHFGGVKFDQHWPRGFYHIEDGGPYLEAPVVALESRTGSWAIWAEDPKFGPKALSWINTPSGFGLLLESRNLSPFDAYHNTTSVTWHLNCSRGSWVQAASFYRKWFHSTFSEDLATRAPAWASRIRVICECLPLSEQSITLIASAFDPSTVLLHAWNARIANFDHDLPDFAPRQDFIDSVRLSHHLHFHTCAYLNAYCVNKNSPLYVRDNLQDLILLRSLPFQPRKQLAEYRDGELVYTDPLSPRWREFHAQLVRHFADQTNTDAVYEDVAGTSGDHGNGSVDGVYAGRGSYEALRAVRKVIPGVPLAAEYNTESIAPFTLWPLRTNYLWGDDTFQDALSIHASPFEAYIFGPDVLAWTQVSHTAIPDVFHRALDYADSMGGLTWILGPTWIHVTHGNQALALYRAALFAKLQLKPDFPETKWPPDAVAFYKDSEGDPYMVAERNGQVLVGPRGDELYRRTRALTHVKTRLVIPGWPAYDVDGPVGLNAAVKYSLIPGKRGGTRLQVNKLPFGACIDSYREGDGFVVLGLNCQGQRDTVSTMSYHHSYTPELVMVNGSSEKPTGTGINRRLSVPFNATVIWIEKPISLPDSNGYLGSGAEDGQVIEEGLGIAVDVQRNKPVWSQTEHGPAVDLLSPSAGMELLLDYVVTVPSSASVLKVFGTHTKTSYKGDVTVRLLVNGRPVFAKLVRPDDVGWWCWQVPLGFLKGRPAIITLVSNNTNAGNLKLTRPQIVSAPETIAPSEQSLPSH
jgi:hypothetical protein